MSTRPVQTNLNLNPESDTHSLSLSIYRLWRVRLGAVFQRKQKTAVFTTHTTHTDHTFISIFYLIFFYTKKYVRHLSLALVVYYVSGIIQKKFITPFLLAALAEWLFFCLKFV